VIGEQASREQTEDGPRNEAVQAEIARLVKMGERAQGRADSDKYMEGLRAFLSYKDMKPGELLTQVVLSYRGTRQEEHDRGAKAEQTKWWLLIMLMKRIPSAKRLAVLHSTYKDVPAQNTHILAHFLSFAATPGDEGAREDDRPDFERCVPLLKRNREEMHSSIFLLHMFWADPKRALVAAARAFAGAERAQKLAQMVRIEKKYIKAEDIDSVVLLSGSDRYWEQLFAAIGTRAVSVRTTDGRTKLAEARRNVMASKHLLVRAALRKDPGEALRVLTGGKTKEGEADEVE
jgi:hypothetical protein